MSYKTVGIALVLAYITSFNSAAPAQSGKEKNEPFMVDTKSGQKFFLKKTNPTPRDGSLSTQKPRTFKSDVAVEARKPSARGGKRLRSFSNYEIK